MPLAELIGEGSCASRRSRSEAALERDAHSCREVPTPIDRHAVHDLLRLGDLSLPRSRPLRCRALPPLRSTSWCAPASPAREGRGLAAAHPVGTPAHRRSGTPPGGPPSLLKAAPGRGGSGAATPHHCLHGRRVQRASALARALWRRRCRARACGRWWKAFSGRRTGRDWCTRRARVVRSRSLAALRKEVEPVEPHVLGRFLVSWHGLIRPRAGLDALLDVVERLQGAPLVASVLEREVLAARVDSYQPALLDTLVSAGEVTWLGVEPLVIAARPRCTARTPAPLAPPLDRRLLSEKPASSRVLSSARRSRAADARGEVPARDCGRRVSSGERAGDHDTLHPLVPTQPPARSSARPWQRFRSRAWCPTGQGPRRRSVTDRGGQRHGLPLSRSSC